MTDRQAEALRLANEFDADFAQWRISNDTCRKAAAELRRQHARIAELEAQLSAIGAGGVSGPLMGRASIAASAGSEPVATVFTMEALAPGGGVKYHATVHKPLPAGTKLYLHSSPPDGMVMVPKEPTHHMLNAAASAYEDARQSLGAYNAPWAAYRAMLEVAAPPASSADSRKGD